MRQSPGTPVTRPGLELESTGGTTLVTDAAHRRTGIDPSKPAPNDFQEIPDSSFTPVMDTDSIFLGDPATYTAVTTVTPPGGIVDMTLDRYVNWRIVQTATFLALGVTRGSKLTLRLPKGSALRSPPPGRPGRKRDDRGDALAVRHQRCDQGFDKPDDDGRSEPGRRAHEPRHHGRA